ncbi:MAG: excinuclease ABC subunit UvrB [Nitrospinae bacterium]|nr:excinuclease ABC subunit UvrB [Nitrospinota bacterium]
MPKDIPFKLVSPYVPTGDQPTAIETLVANLDAGLARQILLGVTGSGKTYTIAQVIQRTQRPALVIAHNKTLAAQLYAEFKGFFPDNAVEYFVSYYDYYQPEAYLPTSDSYIEKDAGINDEIDKLRHSATMALFERRDVIIVASVSCIYGLGAPEHYQSLKIPLAKGAEMARDDLLTRLVDIHYERNNVDFARGTFRVNGDVVEILPVYETDTAVRVEFFGDEIDALSLVDPLTGRTIKPLDEINIYPASHYATGEEAVQKATVEIRQELLERVAWFQENGKLLEAQRIEERTMADLEMIKAVGYCKGIENYSRYLSGRPAGSPPPTLLEYLPDDALVIIDESHQSVGQIGGMLKGDRSRKATLIDYGFRLPSALDNRPLSFDEFEELTGQTVYVSATPGAFERERCGGAIAEQVIRPTGLVDPEVDIRPVKSQVDDLLAELRLRAQAGERVLVACMTKRQAEDLTDYYQGLGVRCRYLHSDIATLERMTHIQELRAGEYDVLIGINLLREGLDIPEVSLVAILNADMEGFLRSETSLIQTSGRAARNLNGRVIFYADTMTGSITRAVAEMERRRKKQLAYNAEHGITATSVKRALNDAMSNVGEKDYVTVPKPEEGTLAYLPEQELARLIRQHTAAMQAAAKELDFEKAAQHRDRIRGLKRLAMT